MIPQHKIDELADINKANHDWSGYTDPVIMYLGLQDGQGNLAVNNPGNNARVVNAYQQGKPPEVVDLPPYPMILPRNDQGLEAVEVWTAIPPNQAPGQKRRMIISMNHTAGSQANLGEHAVTPFESEHNQIASLVLVSAPANYIFATPNGESGSGYMRRQVLADIPTGATLGQPLLAGATAPAYGALDLANANAITGIAPVTHGGSGAATLTAHALIIGNSTSAVNFLAPSTARNVAISDGTDWASRALVAADTPQVLPLAGGTLTGPIIFTPQATPSTAEGKVYYDSTAHALEYYNGSAWVTLTADTGITQLTGDVTAGPGAGSQAATLATVNSNVGPFAIATVTVNAKGLVTAASAAATTGSGNVVLATSPTIVTPTIADFTNATHTHQTPAGGGTLTTAAIASGTFANSFINWAAPGTLGSTTPNTGALTNLTITGGGYIRPSADGTSAILVTKADGSTTIGQIDTTNILYGLGNNPSAPAQLLDLYDGYLRFTQLSAPGACTAALAGLGAGNVNTGTHSYKVTFVTSAGETQAGTASNTVTTSAGNGQVSLTSIPTGAAGTTSRKIYRTKAGAAVYFLLTTISDNTTTTYADNIADSSLTTVATGINTTGGGIYSGSTQVFGVDQSGRLIIGALGFVAASSSTGNIASLSLQISPGNQTSLTTASADGNAMQLGTAAGPSVRINSNSGAVCIGDGAINAGPTGTLLVLGRTTLLPVLVVQQAASASLNNTEFRDSTGAARSFIASDFSATLNVFNATTSGISTALTLLHTLTTANAGAAGIGVDLIFRVADDASAIGAGNQVARIRSYLPVASHLSRTGQSVWSVSDSAAPRDVIGIGANGSAALLGFYPTIAAAPIAQPTSSRAIDLALSDLGLRAAGTPSLSLLGTYNGDTLGGNGLASLMPRIALTAQTASIGATTIFTPAAEGDYLITVALTDTTASTSGGTVSATISWTDENGANSTTTAILTLAALGDTTLVIPIHAKASAVQYSTTVSGVIVGSPTYSLYIDSIKLA